MRTRLLPLHLEEEQYHRLEQVAEANERDPMQQARWLLKEALTRAAQPKRERGVAGGRGERRPPEGR